MGSWLDELGRVDGWQPHGTAPKDGTPILVDAGGVLGVFVWETRQEILGETLTGEPMPPTWAGFLITTELTPAFEDGDPLPDRFFPTMELEEPFWWQPLPPHKGK